MPSNLDRYREDLKKLINEGDLLLLSMEAECFPDQVKKHGEKYIKSLPFFTTDYQPWYSQAQAVIKQLLPDRHSDFVSHYEKPKQRKELTNENYRISDYLQGLSVSQDDFGRKVVVVKPSAAISHLVQQVAILKSVNGRFESSLFDIQQLVQADLFDSELDAAAELAKHKFFRAAGAVAGVVLEHHLGQVCTNHNVKISKKSPTIADFNDALKSSNVIELAVWRFIQHLGDLRNKCDHDKQQEPTADEIGDLIAGVLKITKTVF